MACYAPLKGFKGVSGGISWSPPVAYVDRPMTVPCGQCVGCRLERARQWAVRLMHEASLYDSSLFVTLTYDDEHLPADRSLDKRHFQLFMKKLRKRVEARVPYFHCGEYGDLNGRPHYHAILFDLDFPDKREWSNPLNERANKLWESPLLNSVWGLGQALFGAVTFESAGYVARYCLKKVTGDLAPDHYRRVDENGEVYYLQPEYATMSSRPAIGKGWFEKYSAEVGVYDGVVVDGRVGGVPRYYDKLRKRADADRMKQVKFERVVNALKYVDNNTAARLAVRKKVKEASLRTLKRTV